jgi:SAM-dependent methyltransferase
MTCPLCLSKKNLTLFSATNFHGRHKLDSQKFIFKKCLKCGCIFPIIKVDKNYYQKYYPKNYQIKNSFLGKTWQKISFLFKKYFIPDNISLLDVGCGQGDFLKSLSSTINATGIDLNPILSSDIKTIKDDYLKHHFTQKYDLITFWHSLEHFSNPRQAINKSLSLLKKHGHILISIPNTNSLAFKIAQNKWFHLDPPRHLFLPNDQNIRKLFPKTKHLKIYYLPFEFPLDLFWSLKKKPYLRLIYPLLKLFDHETILIYFEKS